MAPRLRQSDLTELKGLGYDGTGGLLASYENAKSCWSFMHQSELICMFGVSYADEPQIGLVWMLGSDILYQHRQDFLNASKLWVQEMMQGHNRLENIIDQNNKDAIRWLKWLGFQFQDKPVANLDGYLAFFLESEANGE